MAVSRAVLSASAILKEAESELLKRYPDLKFKYFQYPKEITEIIDDSEWSKMAADW